MDQGESGVRNYESGYSCPDLVRLNFLPFAPEVSLSGLVNVSGYSGPINLPSGTIKNTLSGVVGAGTLYPASGSMEELSRLFWCVKSWTLSVQVNAVLNSVQGDFFPSLLTAGTVGGGQYGSINDVSSKTLHLVDVNDPSIKASHPYQASALQAQAVPMDPIESWNDLMCRDKYFSWAAPEYLSTGWSSFNSPYFFQYSPYVMPFNVLVETPLEYDLSPPCYGLWSLSIMNADRYARKRNSTVTGFTGFYTPTGIEDTDKNYNFLAPPVPSWSGSLTDASGTGVITGYGFYPVSSGFPLLYFRPPCDPVRDPFTSGCVSGLFDAQAPNNYLPMIDFFLYIRTFLATSYSLPTMASIVSTVRRNVGWVSAGTFSIVDSNITGYPAGQTAKQIFKCPLYCPASSQGQQVVTVTLSPNSYWLTGQGLINY